MIVGTVAPEDITMQAIADASGVSHRTLYRYFPSRQELIERVGEEFDRQIQPGSADILSGGDASFEDWIASIRPIIEFGAVHAGALRRGVAMGVTHGEWRRGRDEGYWTLFRRRFPHLSEQVAREDFAALRQLLSANNAFLMGQRFEMTPDQVISALERNVAALVRAIDERDREAAQEGSDDHDE